MATRGGSRRLDQRSKIVRQINRSKRQDQGHNHLGEFDYATNYRNALQRQAAWQQALRQVFKKVRAMDHLRQPVFLGTRDEKNATEVVRERAS